MIGEFKISDKSCLVDKNTDEIQKNYQVKLVHLHIGLPSTEGKRITNPPPQKICSGMYMKVQGSFRNVTKLMEDASS